tara:strand:- start:443 stop:979 length:537 start_codon:yes stop_codon:yes gene_type:complete
MKSPIVLLGYMGSGKTKVGKKLSKKIGIKFYDLDQEIELFCSKSINQIFNEIGEIKFRELEQRILIKILNKDEFYILSLGGGTPCYFNNMELISNKTKNTFYINLDSKVLANRLFLRKTKRPLISSIDTEKEMLSFVNKHLFERIHFYKKASYMIKSSKKDVNKTCKSILTILEDNGS